MDYNFVDDIMGLSLFV